MLNVLRIPLFPSSPFLLEIHEGQLAHNHRPLEDQQPEALIDLLWYQLFQTERESPTLTTSLLGANDQGQTLPSHMIPSYLVFTPSLT